MATTITANGINFPDGSAGSPSIGGTDTNTGLFTGSDIVGFATGGSERLRIDASGNINIANDSGKLQLGTSADLQIYHNGTHSYLDNSTGYTFFRSNSVSFNGAGGSETMAAFVKDGACELYYDNSLRLETTSSGTRTTGAMHINDGAADGNRISVGNGGDLKIFHTNPVTYIQDSSTALVINSARLDINNAADNEQMARFTQDGGVELYHNNSKRFETTVEGFIAAGGNLEFDDTSATDRMLLIGTDNSTTARWSSTRQGMKIVGTNPVVYFHDSSNSKEAYVGGSGGNIYLGASESGNIKFQTAGSGTSTTQRWSVEADGHFEPAANNTYDIGSSSYRVRNIYTNDLNLSNEGGANDVDGTWGSFTIQEGAEDLFLVNRRNGKKYKFNLTEVS